MSFINFESARAKENARNDLRDAREELLKKVLLISVSRSFSLKCKNSNFLNYFQAELKSKQRDERDQQAKLRGDDTWMLPSVSKKIDKMSQSSSKKKKKKEKKKKEKKPKKEKKKRRKGSSSDSDSSSEEEVIKKKKKKKKWSSSSSSDSSSDDPEEDEWIEKKFEEKPVSRDDWMSGVSFQTYSKTDKLPKEEKVDKESIDSYKPGNNSRELNPYWKDGGTGLPTFKKPNFDSDEEDDYKSRMKTSSAPKGNWRKKDYVDERRKRSRSKSKTPENHRKKQRSSSRSSEEEEENHETPEIRPSKTDFLTDQQMNELGAKLIKAEIMGNENLAKELNEKLIKARSFRTANKDDESYNKKRKEVKNPKNRNEDSDEVDEILLTKMNDQGISRPLEGNATGSEPNRGRKRTKKVETHVGKERVRYFPDDDKYDIKQMFEREKFTSANDQDAEFVKIAGSHKNPNDDLDDIFSEKIQKGVSDSKRDEKERSDAIRRHQEITRTLDTCDKCFDSTKMEKQLIVAMGTNVYLSLPWHEGLQTGHCLIVPMQHVSCSTQLDEDVWEEIKSFQKAITRMFDAKSQDVIFFETARNLHKRPHCVIHCVPSKEFEMAPFYFKKAIQESEREWSTNKQLVDLKKEKKDLKRAIPKGLPYFWVDFGVDSGFAHVIEEQDRFPSNFAQEIIGGILNLDARHWRKPRKEFNPISKVKQFADWWKKFDCTQN